MKANWTGAVTNRGMWWKSTGAGKRLGKVLPQNLQMEHDTTDMILDLQAPDL